MLFVFFWTKEVQWSGLTELLVENLAVDTKKGKLYKEVAMLNEVIGYIPKDLTSEEQQDYFFNKNELKCYKLLKVVTYLYFWY